VSCCEAANTPINDYDIEAEGSKASTVEGPCMCLLTLDSLEGVGSDSSILFLQESLKPLPCCVDVLGPEEILHSFGCIVLSKVLYQQEMTYKIVAS